MRERFKKIGRGAGSEVDTYVSLAIKHLHDVLTRYWFVTLHDEGDCGDSGEAGGFVSHDVYTSGFLAFEVGEKRPYERLLVLCDGFECVREGS